MPRFVQLSGDRAGTSYPATEGAILGRDSDCEVTLVDGSVSRRHARLIYRDGEWQVIDMGSRNGLYSGARKIDSCVLRAGDELTLGKVRMRFQLDSGSDWERAEVSEPAKVADEQATAPMIQASSLLDPVESRSKPPSPKLSIADRRARRIVELQGKPGGGLLSGDLLQRSGPVRWLIYILVVVVAIGACVGAFSLAQFLRG